MMEINEKTMAASPTHKVTSDTPKKRSPERHFSYMKHPSWPETYIINQQPTPGLFQAKVTYAISGNVQFPTARLRDEHVKHVPT